MSAGAEHDDAPQRIQGLLDALENVSDPLASATARELVRAVIELHGIGLAELLAIVDEAGTQPADTLLAKFAANPRVSGLLLLHDLHPRDLPTRARAAAEHLRPHLAVRGVRIDFVGVEGKVVHVCVSASGQNMKRPTAAELRREIEEAVLAATPDALDLLIDGLDAAGNANEVYVPLSALGGRTRGHDASSERAGEKISATGD